jgi:hypothetical protein
MLVEVSTFFARRRRSSSALQFPWRRDIEIQVVTGSLCACVVYNERSRSTLLCTPPPAAKRSAYTQTTGGGVYKNPGVYEMRTPLCSSFLFPSNSPDVDLMHNMRRKLSCLRGNWDVWINYALFDGKRDLLKAMFGALNYILSFRHVFIS